MDSSKNDAMPLRREVIVQEMPSGRRDKIPPGYLTYGMILTKTGITKTQFNKLIQLGRLKAERRTEQNWSLYRESDVDALGLKPEPTKETTRPARMFTSAIGTTAVVSDKECHTVFVLLNQGKTAVEIVLETGYHPTVVSTIIREFMHFQGSIVIPRKLVDEINALNLDCEMPVESPEQILTALVSAAKEHRCDKCLRRPRTSMCQVCVTAKLQTRVVKRAGKAAKEAVRATMTDEVESIDASEMALADD